MSDDAKALSLAESLIDAEKLLVRAIENFIDVQDKTNEMLKEAKQDWADAHERVRVLMETDG